MPKTLLHRLSFLLFLLFLSGCSITEVMRVRDRQVIGVDTMVSEIKDSPIILLGERHDAPEHHELQLDVIRKLRSKGKKVAIGMEMFEESSQRALDAWSAGKVPESAFKKVYQWNWRNIPWELYSGILTYARDNRIPLVALNAPREVVQKVARTGMESLDPPDLEQLPHGLDLRMNDRFLEFMRSAYPIHGTSGSAFTNIAEAQLLRNRVMARRIVDYLVRHPETTMVVLTGGGHAREAGGIPMELGNLPRVVVLPTIEGLGEENITTKDGDYLMKEPYWWGDGDS